MLPVFVLFMNDCGTLLSGGHTTVDDLSLLLQLSVLRFSVQGFYLDILSLILTQISNKREKLVHKNGEDELRGNSRTLATDYRNRKRSRSAHLVTQPVALRLFSPDLHMQHEQKHQPFETSEQALTVQMQLYGSELYSRNYMEANRRTMFSR
jgi:hypothetical protein